MHNLFACFLLVFTNQIFAFHGLGESPSKQTGINQTSSHIVIMQTDAKDIYGVYYFAVQNSDSTEQVFSSSIRLPRESVDFQAADGLSNENISILADGVLHVRKVYSPGLTLQGIQFKVPVKKDTDNILTFVPVQEIPTLYFASPQSELLRFSAQGFEDGTPPMLAGGNYTGIRSHSLQAGQQIELKITGFPGGRRPFFILGACMGILLLLLAGLLTLKTSRESEMSPRAVYD